MLSTVVQAACLRRQPADYLSASNARRTREGLPHPEPINDSVMGAVQYRGWLSESWLDKEQKLRLGWEPEAPADDPQTVLFTTFRALPQPVVPQPGQPARRLAYQHTHSRRVFVIAVILQDRILALSCVLPGVTWFGACAIRGTTAQYLTEVLRRSPLLFQTLQDRGIMKAVDMGDR
ncbi:MAG: hypothetical protein GY903_17590 [Fuerstiella sp.]|nr:hypothetical protein [Fuerstiella sp.]MCP4856297.1 hypothetical protein [Fuerstiella sp.]